MIDTWKEGKKEAKKIFFKYMKTLSTKQSEQTYKTKEKLL